jgi:hypothetical protein
MSGERAAQPRLDLPHEAFELVVVVHRPHPD